MSLLTVTKQQDDGSHKLDLNLVVELCIKIVGVLSIFASAWALKQSGNAQAKADKAETHSVSNSVAVKAVSEKVADVEDAAYNAADTAAIVAEKVESNTVAVTKQKAAIEYLGGSGVVEAVNAETK